MKDNGILKLIMHPTKKVLFFFALALFFLVGVFLCVLFLSKEEARPVFAYTLTGFMAIVLYMLYGYIRLLGIRSLFGKRVERKFIFDYHIGH